MTTNPLLDKIDLKRLSDSLNDVATRWDISGGLFVMNTANPGGQLLYRNRFGFADREAGVPTGADTRYILDSQCAFFVKLCLFHLIDQGRLRLADTLSKYIPEYAHASEVRIQHLVKDNTGIPDFYYSGVMKAFACDEDHKALPNHERVSKEKLSLYLNCRFDQVLSAIGDLPLEYPPGTLDRDGSLTNTAFMAEILTRITGLTPQQYLITQLLEPLGLRPEPFTGQAAATPYCTFRHNELIRLPLHQLPPEATAPLFTLSLDDAVQFLYAISRGWCYSEALWQKLLKLDKNGISPLFENANGYYCADVDFMGTGLYFYFNPTTHIAFSSLVNEEQKFHNQNNQWFYFRRDAREAIAAATTFPQHTRLVKLNRENLWHALDLQVEEDQKDFVLEAKSSIAMGLLYPTKIPFAQMEGNLCVGLLVLDVNPKKHWYNIDIILIDKRFQGRGYGKHMVRWSVDYLRKAGAKELNIGVNRYNYGAQKIYMAAGFAPKTVYDEGMTLSMTL